MPSAEVKLAAAAATRKIAADSLLAALKELLAADDPISEVALRDRWLEKMRANAHIYPEGWYIPPPHGMAVLFSTDVDISRTNYEVLRPEPMWPREDIFLDRERGIIMVYASPVDRSTHMIGDFEMMLYFGKQKTIQEHFANTLKLNFELYNFLHPGMTLADLAAAADRLMVKNNLANHVLSLNDPTGTNIGHTVPASYEEWDMEERVVFDNGSWEEIKDAISHKRKFVNQSEPLVTRPGMAFTIEPRTLSPGQDSIPLASFHTMVLVHPDGDKQLLTNFDELFDLAGMDYMPKSIF